MQRVGLLYRDGLSNASDLADRVAALLSVHGLDVWRGGLDDEHALMSVAPDLDLLITFGGDGTIVRAIRSVSQHGVPILGVNLGRLGFLAEVEPERARGDTARSAGEAQYQIEERMILRVRVERSGETLLSTEAVNEVVMATGTGLAYGAHLGRRGWAPCVYAHLRWDHRRDPHGQHGLLPRGRRPDRGP